MLDELQKNIAKPNNSYFTEDYVNTLLSLVNTQVTGDLLDTFQSKILANDASSLKSIFVKLIITDVYDRDLKP